MNEYQSSKMGNKITVPEFSDETGYANHLANEGIRDLRELQKRNRNDTG